MRTAVVAMVFAQQPATTVPTIKEAVSTLDGLRKELEAKQAALSTIDVAERSLIESLGTLDESLATLDDARRDAEKKLRDLRTEIAVIERSMGLDEDELAHLRMRLDARLRAMLADMLLQQAEDEAQFFRALKAAVA